MLFILFGIFQLISKLVYESILVVRTKYWKFPNLISLSLEKIDNVILINSIRLVVIHRKVQSLVARRARRFMNCFQHDFVVQNNIK